MVLPILRELLLSNLHMYKSVTLCVHLCRDPPEPTGDEPEDFEFEAPKIYEPVSNQIILK